MTPERPSASPEPGTTLTVYFDGACPLCAREVAGYRREPGSEQCTWVDAASCAPAALGEDLGRDAALARMTVRRADGSLVHGARAFATLWLTLPRYRRLGRIASARPIAPLLEAGYRLFLRLRPLWRRPRGDRS